MYTGCPKKVHHIIQILVGILQNLVGFFSRHPVNLPYYLVNKNIKDVKIW